MKLNFININLKNKSGVYCIKNIVNHKIYIGSSKNLHYRLNTHYKKLFNGKHINPHLQNAYNSYGLNAFIIEIIEFCENFLEREQYWINILKPYNREIGYNNSQKVNSCYGYKHTDEAKTKMRLAKLGKKQSKETIEKRATALKGKKRTNEQRMKMKKSKLGSKNPMFGKKEDDDHKKNRMKNMLLKPRWNAGLTKETDKRIEKLAFWKGKLPPNAISCSLIDTKLNIRYSAKSLKELAHKSKLSISSINRLKYKSAGKSLTERYYYEES